MVMTDPIADMLTRIRNANLVRHEKLELPASMLKKEIADILKREALSVIMSTLKTINKVLSVSFLSTVHLTSVLLLA